MSEFEQELKQELKRIPAPEGFADRVMQGVRNQRSAGAIVAMPLRRAETWWMSLAALLLLTISVGTLQHERRERQRAAEVQQQFAVAMRITQRTLEVVDEHVIQAGTRRRVPLTNQGKQD